MLPNVRVPISNNNLGRTGESLDGVSLLVASAVAITDNLTLGERLVIRSPQEAENLGITDAYDTASEVLLRQHINEFFDEAGLGTELHVLPVAKTVTMAQMADKTQNYAAKAVKDLEGRIRHVILTRVPDETYIPTYDDGIDNDVLAAVTNLQALREEQYDLHRPFQGYVEGRDWQGNASSSLNLRDAATGPNANRVSVAILQDIDVANSAIHKAKYASICRVAGRKAGETVNRNIARVKSGAIGIENVGFSNNQPLSTFTDTNLNTLDEFGYIFARMHVGVAGYFFNNDHCACPLTDDFAFISRGTVIDKASRLARAVYVRELLDDMPLDPATGRLDVGTVKLYQSLVENEINRIMVSAGECSGVSAYADPAQDVLSTDTVELELSVVPNGRADNIVINLGFSAGLAA